MPVLPTTFLDRSAPCLRGICLDGIPFPALTTLLLSASDLVALKTQLDNIPNRLYLAGSNVTSFAVSTTRLTTFSIQFPSPTYRVRLP